MANTRGPSRFTFDENDLLQTNATGGGGGAVNITEISGNPVALSNPLPVELSDGTNPFGTALNPLSVNVISGGGSNASVGITGDPVPLSSTQIGGFDGSGNLQNVAVDGNGSLQVTNGPGMTVLAIGDTNVGVVPTSAPVTIAGVDAATGQVARIITNSGAVKSNLSLLGGNSISAGNGTSDTGTQRVTLASDSTGQVKLAAGTAVIGHVITDSGSVETVSGVAASGATPSGNPVLIAGAASDNTVRTLSVDTSGRPQVVGAAASGAAPAGNPVLMAGAASDNTARTLSTDTSGRPMVVGAAASGAAPAGNPVLIAGADNANATRTLLMDTSGRPNVDVSTWGATAVQAAATTSDAGTGANPVVRNIGRRYQAVATSSILTANSVFTGSWIDTQQTGDVGIEVQTRADVASATSGLVLQETDDSSDSNFTVNITASTSANFGIGATVSANTTTSVISKVKKRYWRVVYTNGASNQATFKLYVTASNQSIGNVTLTSAGSAIYGGDQFGITTLPASTAIGDASTAVSIGVVGAIQALFNGATWDRARTPTTFKTKSATAVGATAVWTPTSAKKFRVLRYMIAVQETSTLTIGAVNVISLLDSAAAILHTFNVFIPAIALATDGYLYQSPWIDLGNGYLSTAANNVLNVNLAMVLLTGGVDVFVAGTEE